MALLGLYLPSEALLPSAKRDGILSYVKKPGHQKQSTTCFLTDALRDYKTWDTTLILGAGMYAKIPIAWAPGPGREGRDAGHPGGCLWCTELSLSSSSIVGLLRGGRQTRRNKVGSNKNSRLFVWEKQREKESHAGSTCWDGMQVREACPWSVGSSNRRIPMSKALVSHLFCFLLSI